MVATPFNRSPHDAEAMRAQEVSNLWLRYRELDEKRQETEDTDALDAIFSEMDQILRKLEYLANNPED